MRRRSCRSAKVPPKGATTRAGSRASARRRLTAAVELAWSGYRGRAAARDEYRSEFVELGKSLPPDAKVLLRPLPVGFIVDCPWLPGWCGRDIADYLSSETLWFEANRKAIETFPDVWFLPGFWSEFGMCTEPSAFGTRCTFPRNEFPFAEPIIKEVEQIADLQAPDPRADGLLPFMLNRLRWAQPHIEAMGHKIRFSVSRGPLNVATFENT